MTPRQTSQRGASDDANKVRTFYEDHPYPPPVEDLDRHQQTWRNPLRRRVEFHRLWPRRPFQEELDILIAGCGTSQAAKYAMRWPKARVTGIDFSSSSIEHTRKLQQTYSLSNLDLHVLPVEKAGDLDRRFDLIVSTGVLHHLPDPDAGLAALAPCLAPGGVMQDTVLSNKSNPLLHSYQNRVMD